MEVVYPIQVEIKTKNDKLSSNHNFKPKCNKLNGSSNPDKMVVI